MHRHSPGWFRRLCAWLAAGLQQAYLRRRRQRHRRRPPGSITAASPGQNPRPGAATDPILSRAQRIGRAQERFHAAQAEDHQLGGLTPPATPEQPAQTPPQTRQPTRPPPGRGRRR
jgi:hypothetical protein